MELINPTCFVQNLGWTDWEMSFLELFQSCGRESKTCAFEVSCVVSLASRILSEWKSVWICVCAGWAVGAIREGSAPFPRCFEKRSGLG